MAKRKNKGGGYAQRKNQEAQARQRKEQSKAQRNIFIGGLIIIAAIFGVVFLLQNNPPGGGSEPAASTVLEGERPLAALDPAARNNYYSAPPEMVIDTSKEYEAIIVTATGEMRIRLFDDEAPLTVNNFVFLANQGFYDNTTFHRVLENFMAQAGDPTGTGTGGPGYRFADETDNGLGVDRRGLLAMANSGANTNGSQFFITFSPQTHLSGAHTVFGELIEGDDVLSAIRLRAPQTDTQPGDTLLRVDIVEIES